MIGNMFDLDKIESVIAKVEIALAIVPGIGEAEGTPLVTLSLDEQGNLWFFIKKNNPLYKRLTENSRLHLIYNDSYLAHHLIIESSVNFIADPELKKQLWHPSLIEWLLDGPESSNILLMKAKITGARYWDKEGACMRKVVSTDPVRLPPLAEQKAGSGVRYR